MSIEEIVENIGLPPKDEVKPSKPRRKHEMRKLYWYERQYGAGFISGFWVGIAAGLPLAMGIAAVCKWFVDWLFSMPS